MLVAALSCFAGTEAQSMAIPESVTVNESHDVPRRGRRIGAILVDAGKLRAGDVKRVLELQETEGIRFGEAALSLSLITVDDLRGAIASQYDLPRVLLDSEGVSRELVVAYEPLHHCAEQIRALRTQLLIRWTNCGITRRVLAIVSPGAGEGRSYIAANLAVAFSQLGDRTLLIDANLRSPRQQQIFLADDKIGLTAVLSGRAECRAALVPIPELGTLSLLPAGARPPHPLELLSRNTLPALLEEVQNDFDVILLDTPAAKLCADALTVAFRAGAALVLARRDSTALADTSSLIGELTDARVSIVGSVLNAFGPGGGVRRSMSILPLLGKC
jgi:protein-tyrosine kinase